MAETTAASATALTLTPAFAPPESFDDPTGSVHADVYSLGATLWALIAGRPPFTNPDSTTPVTQLVGRIATAAVGDLRRVAPTQICDVIEQAMQKRPDDRPPSAASFGRALAAARAASGSFKADARGFPVAGWRETHEPTDGVMTTIARSVTAAEVPPPPNESSNGLRDRRRVAYMASTVVLSLVLVALTAFVLLRGSDDGQEASTRAGSVATEGADTVAPTATPPESEAPTIAPVPTATEPAPSPSPIPTPTVVPTTTPTAVPTETATATPVPVRPSGDLGLAQIMTVPACDGSFVVIIQSAVTPGGYVNEIQAGLSAHPGTGYLRTDQACSSLRQTVDDGSAIYAVFSGPFADQAGACAEAARIGGGAYVRLLDDVSSPNTLYPC